MFAEGLWQSPNPEASAEGIAATTASDEAEARKRKTSAEFDSSDFDRLLEAVSSGGMSDNLKSGSGGVLEGMDLQGPTRRLNSTLNTTRSSNPTPTGKSADDDVSQSGSVAMQPLSVASDWASIRDTAKNVDKTSVQDDITGNPRISVSEFTTDDFRASVRDPTSGEATQQLSNADSAATQLMSEFTD